MADSPAPQTPLAGLTGRVPGALAGCLLVAVCGLVLAVASPALAAAPPCANLEVAHVSVTPTSLIAGQPASISIEVKNNGTCAAGSFVTEFKLSQFASAAVSETTSPPLKPGGSETLTLPYDFPKAGNFQTAVVINPAHEVAEANYLKDTVIKALTVAAAKANIAIKSIAVSSHDPTNAVVQNRPALAVVVVENTGNIAASPFYVQWTPQMFGKGITAPQPGGLEPGHSEVVEIEYTYTTKGPVTSTFSAVASGGSPLFSSKTKEFTVEAALANLRIAHVSEHPAFNGKPSTIEVAIENNGNAGAGPFLVEWKPGKGQTAQTQQINELPEYGVATVTFTNVFASAGTYEGLVTLDPTHKVKELFATEKTAKTHLVIPESTVDLTVTNIVINKGNPALEGVQAAVLVTVENLGSATSPSFVIAFNPNSPFGVSSSSSQTIDKEETQPLAPGEERTIELHFTYAKAGLFRTVVEVNPARTVKESNYANNALLDEVTVATPELELEFLNKGIHFSSPEISAKHGLFVNEKATATFTVINRGPLATGAFAVQFQRESIGKPPIEGQKEGFKATQFIAGLNPGESEELTFNASYGKPGTYIAKAVIDPFESIHKTKVPDAETETVVVHEKEAKLKIGVPKLSIEYSPGNLPTPSICFGGDLSGCLVERTAHFTDWTTYLFVYAPGQKCKVQNYNASGELVTKTVNNIEPEEGGKFCPREEFTTSGGAEPNKPTPKLKTAVKLTEEQALNAETMTSSWNHHEINITLEVCFLFICKTYHIVEHLQAWEPAFPGQATLKRSRPEYIKGLSPNPTSVRGVGCHDETQNEEPQPSPPAVQGDCFTAFFELTEDAITGPAVVRAHGTTPDAARLLAKPAAEPGEEGEEGEESEETAKEKSAEEREVAEREAIETESAEAEAEAERRQEREKAEAEATEQVNAEAAIEGAELAVDELAELVEQESNAAIKGAGEEAEEAAEKAREEGAEIAPGTLSPATAAALTPALSVGKLTVLGRNPKAIRRDRTVTKRHRRLTKKSLRFANARAAGSLR